MAAKILLIVFEIFIGVLTRGSFNHQDTRYDLIAVSWGKPVSEDDLWVYQVQAQAGKPDNKGAFEVAARVCMEVTTTSTTWGASVHRQTGATHCENLVPLAGWMTA